jgi:phosphotriesterase-related protein
VIKLASGKPPFTAYDQMLIKAAADAARLTGAPIITHTEAIGGELQLQMLKDLGVDPARVIVGHSCGNPDHAYHRQIVDAGAYIGFDRFGLERILPDEQRVKSLVRMVESGAADRVIVSHDCIFHRHGAPMPSGAPRSPLHFTRVIEPQLKALGVQTSVIDSMLVDNPRRYFEGSPSGHRVSR